MQYIHIQDNEIELISDAKIDNGQYDKIIELSIPQGKEVYIEKGEAKLRDIDYNKIAQEQFIENKKARLKQVQIKHAEYLNLLTGYATAEERDTWNEKKSLAKACLAGDKKATALLQIEAKLRKTTSKKFAQNIIDKSEQYVAGSLALSGYKDEAENEVMAAKSDDEINQAFTAFDNKFQKLLEESN